MSYQTAFNSFINDTDFKEIMLAITMVSYQREANKIYIELYYDGTYRQFSNHKLQKQPDSSAFVIEIPILPREIDVTNKDSLNDGLETVKKELEDRFNKIQNKDEFQIAPIKKIELNLTDKQLGLLKYAVVVLNNNCNDNLYYMKKDLESCDESRTERLKERITDSEACQKNVQVVLDQITVYLKEISTDCFR